MLQRFTQTEQEEGHIQLGIHKGFKCMLKDVLSPEEDYQIQEMNCYRLSINIIHKTDLNWPFH